MHLLVDSTNLFWVSFGERGCAFSMKICNFAVSGIVPHEESTLYGRRIGTRTICDD